MRSASSRSIAGSVKQVVKVPRNVFMPRPNVDSTVLQFRFRERPQLDEAAFLRHGEGMLCAAPQDHPQ